jgi:hypothetical protein
MSGLPLVVLVPLEDQIGLANRLQHFPRTPAVVVEVNGIASLDIDSLTILRVEQRKAADKTAEHGMSATLFICFMAIFDACE